MTTTPFYEDTHATVWHGDCVKVLAGMPDCTFDAVITDPPYDLTAGKKGGTGVASLNSNSPAGRSRISTGNGAGGFMGKSWDSTGVAFDPDTWRAVFRVLKPGGHLLAFGGTRTWHRLVCAIEDAGFEIRDSVAWLYGSGFPKSLDVSKAIDKRRDEDRAPVDAVRAWLNDRRLAAGYSHDDINKHFGHASNGGGSSSAWMTNPTSRSLPTWEQWQELRALFGFGDEMDAEVWRLNGRKGKPGDNFNAREVLSTHVVADIRNGHGREYGGAMFAGEDTGTIVRDITAPATAEAQQWAGYGTAMKPGHEPVCVARKPLSEGTVAGNVLKWGTGGVNIDAMRIGTSDSLGPPYGGGNEVYGTYSMPRGTRTGDALSGRWPANVALDEATAVALDQTVGDCPSKNGGSAAPGGFWGSATDGGSGIRRDDSGGPSRFFYTSKAPASERIRIRDDSGQDNATSYGQMPKRQCNVCGSRTCAAGGDVSGRPWPTCGHEDWSWVEQQSAGEKWISHVTVKPLDLMRWLVRGYAGHQGALILDPFAGSGTTGEAAIAEGMRIVLIEQDASYLPLIKARVTRRTDPVEHLRTVGEDLGLFGLDEESL